MCVGHHLLVEPICSSKPVKKYPVVPALAPSPAQINSQMKALIQAGTQLEPSPCLAKPNIN